MNKSSIFLKINIIFIIAVLALTSTFFPLYFFLNKKEGKLEIRHIMKKMHRLELELKRYKKYHKEHYDKEEIYKNYNFKVLNQKQGAKIKQKALLIFNNHRRYKIYLFDKKIYILNKKNNTIYENTELQEKNYFKEFILIAYILILIFIYLIYKTLKKTFQPLKTLEEEIKKLGQGKTDINTKTNKKDEISIVSNEFHKAVEKIKSLENARSLFLRNIMHELKTPITKGKISTALLKDENKEILENVFTRLELLIKEMANIEKLNTKNYDLVKKNYRIIDLIDNAKDLLFIKNGVIEIFKNENINVDFKLFSIVIKNLIDNALKYSKDKKIYIYIKENKLHFKSLGAKLKKDFKDYTEAFFKGELNKENQKGFGLGLYIVNEILKKHDFDFAYNYEDGYNIFIIKTEV